jgi:Flp pilus assembly protein TadD
MIILTRAITDVQLCLIPDARINYLSPKSRMQSYLDRNMRWVWPALLVILILGLGQADIRRITSGLLYMISNREHFNGSDDPHSMNLLKVAEKVDPSAAFVYNEEGYKLFQEARLPEAEVAFVQAIQVDQTSAPALNNMAVMYFTTQDIPQATVNLKEAVEQDPNNAIARYNLGILLMQQNEPANAIREFRQAGFIDPTAASPHLQLALLYVQMGDYGSAEQHARESIQLDPSQTSAHLLLAIALYHQGKDTEALVSITDSLRLDPGNRVASFYQAHILERIDQYDVALSILERLLASSTDDQESARISVEIDAIRRALSVLDAAAH